MNNLVGKSGLLRAALVITLSLLDSPWAVADESQPILQFNRADRVASPPAEAGSPGRGSLETNSPAKDSRMLAPPSRQQIASPGGVPSGAKPRAAFALPKMESFTTAGAGLAIVVGLFLVCMWLLRRGGPKPTSPLPTDAVQVLGRVPLAGRNFANLLQIGNKLVLVAITPDGVTPIAEVTDPVEVQRLLGLCLRNNKSSTTAEFQSVLEKLAQEPASGFLGNQAAASYASQSR